MVSIYTGPGISEKEEQFNNAIRDSIIVLLTFIILYIFSYCIIYYFHRKRERDGWNSNEDDAKVYRISLYLCTVTLVVSFSNVLLLPMSTLANEIVHLFPQNYWVQWLNGDLVDKMWATVYFSSNISIFALLPFSYFFMESEGFSGNQKGILPRIYETIVVLLLFAVLVFGIVALTLAFIDGDNTGLDFVLFVGEYYVHHIYSFLLCCSAFVILTFCAPLGMSMMFDIAGDLLVKPRLFFDTSEDDIYLLEIQEEDLKRRHQRQRKNNNQQYSEIENEMKELQSNKEKLVRQQKASGWERNVGYPIVMLLLIVATGFSLFLVILNILQHIFYGSSQTPEFEKANSLGLTSLSTFGFFGSLLALAVQIYLIFATFLGFYNLPLLRRLRPVKNDTAMTTLIWNCVFLQLLTSAMPVLSTVLGITDFTLRGNYKSFYWINDFYIVFTYNLIFATVAALCLAKKVTIKVRTELYKALGINHLHNESINKSLVTPDSPKLKTFPNRRERNKSFEEVEILKVDNDPGSSKISPENVVLITSAPHSSVRCRKEDECLQKTIS